ncbi:MAG: GTP 3',8-cyclase MoaA [Anaerolineae bacterium]|nr:GTP 3',8-cyclase MoaA [Anaerolineae bacterium]
MTLYDAFNRPLENLRISVTDRCNFRCSYCMPAHKFPQGYRFITNGDLLTFAEIVRLARIFSRLGVRKIRLTGGEPLVRPHIERLVGMLSQVDGIHDIAMTTNGYLLPQKAKLLREQGLKRLNISLDSLDAAIFKQMNGGRAEVSDVLSGIEAAERAGFVPLKINTVVQRGVNDHTLVDLALYFRQHGHIIRFIEFMDTGTLNGWKYDHVLLTDDLIQQIGRVIPLEPLRAQHHGEVVRRYRYADGSGELGFITSVSKPFCGGCNRLRLSAEGKMYTCLFARKGVDLRDLLRAGASDDTIIERITQTWQQRADRYSEERSSGQRTEKVEMYHMGG